MFQYIVGLRGLEVSPLALPKWDRLPAFHCRARGGRIMPDCEYTKFAFLGNA